MREGVARKDRGGVRLLVVNREEAMVDLSERFDARLNGLGLQHIAAGSQPRIPPETADVLARLAVDWAIEHGAEIDP
jgi:hypothetical protein